MGSLRPCVSAAIMSSGGCFFLKLSIMRHPMQPTPCETSMPSCRRTLLPFVREVTQNLCKPSSGYPIVTIGAVREALNLSASTA